MLYEWQWHPETEVNIYNNTLYENNRYLSVPGKVEQEPYELCILADVYKLRIYNNLFYKSSEYFVIYAIHQNNMRSDNNCIYKTTGVNDAAYCFYNRKAYTYNGWKAATNGDANSIAVNPQFISSGMSRPNDFKLICGSPCQGAGTTTVSAIVTKDFEGKPFDGRDIGAFLVSCGDSDVTPPKAPTNFRVIVNP
jgi:hypothetical protein